MDHAHSVLAESCVLYLAIFNSEEACSIAHRDNLFFSGPDEEDGQFDYGKPFFFRDYSVKSWHRHFRKADPIGGDALIPFVARIW